MTTQAARRATGAVVVALAWGAFLAAPALATPLNFIHPLSSPESAGDRPRSLAAADLDGDGDQDLAVANHDSDNVTILKNNGGGNFFEPPSSPEAVGITPQMVMAADLDGDGDQDLAVANYITDNVTILKNPGGGNFFEPPSSPEPAGDGPHAVAASDLDGDGDQDLAVANNISDDVTILKNPGGGSFFEPPSSPEPAGRAPWSVATADLEGDGDEDLAVVNLASGDVTILGNQGGGNLFELASSPEQVGERPTSIAVTDLDGDGDQDLAVPDIESDLVTILNNDGTADFAEPASSPELVGDAPESVAAADFDGDGDQDVAVANGLSSAVTILRNDGVGDFLQPALSPEAVGVGPTWVAAADLDGDLDQDLATANQDSDDVSILRKH